MSRIRSFVLFAAVAATWAGGLGAPSHAATNFGVEIKNTAYNPKATEVTVGDTVTWTNLDDDEHTVTFDDGFDSNPQCPGLLSPCLQKGQSTSRLFTAVGSYKYHCRIHVSMTGTVTVESVTASTSPSVGSTTSTTLAATPASSTTSTTLRAVTTTTRVVDTSPPVLRTTTTTAGTAYTPAPQGEAPAFDPERNEDISPVPDPDEAAEELAEGRGDETAAGGEADDDGGGGGGAAVIVALLVLAAGGGGALLWKFRPKRA